MTDTYKERATMAETIIAPTALERFTESADLLASESPLERLRYFLSLALNGQDWLDVEQFLDAIPLPPSPESKP